MGVQHRLRFDESRHFPASLGVSTIASKLKLILIQEVNMVHTISLPDPERGGTRPT